MKRIKSALVLLLAVVAIGCHQDALGGGAGDARFADGSASHEIPPGCLSNACVRPSDCAFGEGCNSALNPPMCETLSCGGQGASCSDDSLCAFGLRCCTLVCAAHCDPETVCDQVCSLLSRCPVNPMVVHDECVKSGQCYLANSPPVDYRICKNVAAMADCANKCLMHATGVTCMDFEQCLLRCPSCDLRPPDMSPSVPPDLVF